MAHHLFSVCMIVRNEASGIARAIESSRFLDPEYIVLDTGSTDGTQDVLRSLGIEPKPFKWVDDFAAARNQALFHAEGDWVLSLDGDEVLTPFDYASACRSTPAASFRIEKRSYCDDSLQIGYHGCSGEYPLLERGHKGYLSEPNDLLFRNAPGVYWKGAVHETVGQSLQSPGKPLPGALIHNYGRSKAKDYALLVRKRLAQDPKDPIAWYYAGLEELSSASLEEAERSFAVSISLGKTDHAVFGLAKTQLNLGKLSLAEQGFVEYLRMRPKEFPAWVSLLTTVMLRKDQERLDYYVASAEKAGMGTKDLYKFAAYASGRLGNTEVKEYYAGKEAPVNAPAAAGQDHLPDGPR